jgi:hypothetical protein
MYNGKPVDLGSEWWVSTASFEGVSDSKFIDIVDKTRQKVLLDDLK